MIADLRIYTCKPGKLKEFLGLYERLCWPIQQKYLGRCLGWYTVVEGRQNRVVHIWGYDSQADREEKRKKMASDPEFHAYLKAVAEADVLVDMENSIVTPTSFFEAAAAK